MYESNLNESLKLNILKFVNVLSFYLIMKTTYWAHVNSIAYKLNFYSLNFNYILQCFVDLKFFLLNTLFQKKNICLLSNCFLNL